MTPWYVPFKNARDRADRLAETVESTKTVLEKILKMKKLGLGVRVMIKTQLALLESVETKPNEGEKL